MISTEKKIIKMPRHLPISVSITLSPSARGEPQNLKIVQTCCNNIPSQQHKLQVETSILENYFEFL